MIQLSAIWTFPIKSAQGFTLTETEIFPRGLKNDRRWMLVDAEGGFLSQREHPEMTQIRVILQSDHLHLSAPGAPDLTVSLIPTGVIRDVTIWRDQIQAHLVSGAADQWFSQILGFPCQLVQMLDSDQRPLESWPGVEPGHEVSFADGYPLLLIGEGSLADLNAKLPEPVTMSHFRPNLVVSGTTPFEEDSWGEIAIGSARLKVVKPCRRCVMVTLDPDSGQKIPNGEPLRTLSQYRKTDFGVLFGQNLIVTQPGKIKVGDEVMNL